MMVVVVVKDVLVAVASKLIHKETATTALVSDICILNRSCPQGPYWSSGLIEGQKVHQKPGHKSRLITVVSGRIYLDPPTL